MNRLLPIFLMTAILLTGCGQAGTTAAGSIESASETEVPAVLTSAVQTGTDMFTSRDYEVGYDASESTVITLEGSSASCSSSAVTISGGTVTLTDEGTYILSGSLEDGMVIIDAEKTDKLQLVLDNVSINSASSAAIYVLQADKVFITLAADSENTLSNGGAFETIDENNIDSVIFSKDDLTLNGSGSLIITSPAGHGIVSKDDLVVTSGNYNITASGHGLSGKDSVRIAGGSFTIDSGKDAIRSENTEDSELGFIYISGGSYDLCAGSDGLSASGWLQIQDGSFDILAGGGSPAVVKTSSSDFGFFGRETETAVSEDSASTKGIKASGSLIISGGSLHIDSADDAIHSNANLVFSGGSCTIATGDDGLHADAQLCISGGTIQITKSYEGIEGLSIDISGGEISLASSDDGLNAAGGADQSGFGGFRGGDAFAASDDCYISITGGKLNISASGDGIDSNGSLSISGGEIYVSGPTDGANGALDYESEAVISGGIIVATGSSQMAQNFGSGSTQGAIMVSTGSQANGSQITLTDSSGNLLVSWQSEKAFDCVIISCPGITGEGEYTLSAGSYTESITMAGLVYSSAGLGGMGAMGGMGGIGGEPGDMEAPPDGSMGTPPEGGMENVPDSGMAGHGGQDGPSFGGFGGGKGP